MKPEAGGPALIPIAAEPSVSCEACFVAAYRYVAVCVPSVWLSWAESAVLFAVAASQVGVVLSAPQRVKVTCRVAVCAPVFVTVPKTVWLSSRPLFAVAVAVDEPLTNTPHSWIDQETTVVGKKNVNSICEPE
jgi:hypothetical protein